MAQYTPYLRLKKPDYTDPADIADINNNFDIIDTAASGGGFIPDGSVTASKLADAAVTTAAIANSAVDVNKLADLSVTAAKLADGSITTPKLADAAIDTTKLKDAAITTAKLANLAVSKDKLADLAVDASKLANSSVTATKIANAAVGSAAIANAAIGSAHIANGAILNAHIADAQISSAKIQNGAIGTAQIADAAITSAKIANAAIGSAAIATGAIGSAHIANAAILNAHIGNLEVDYLKVADNAITSDKLAQKISYDDSRIIYVGTWSYGQTNTSGDYFTVTAKTNYFSLYVPSFSSTNNFTLSFYLDGNFLETKTFSTSSSIQQYNCLIWEYSLPTYSEHTLKVVFNGGSFFALQAIGIQKLIRIGNLDLELRRTWGTATLDSTGFWHNESSAWGFADGAQIISVVETSIWSPDFTIYYPKAYVTFKWPFKGMAIVNGPPNTTVTVIFGAMVIRR